MKKVLRWVLAAILGQGLVAAQVIYATGPGPRSPYTLYRISPSTGAGTEIGPIFGFIGEDAADFAPNGTLYSSGLDFLLATVLLKLDPATGAATKVASVTGVLPGLVASGFAFRSDGVLFALYGSTIVYTINVTTGAATLIGIPNTASFASGLAFSATDVLYVADTSNLYTINQNTGSATIVTHLTFDPSFGASPVPNAMRFDLATGRLYAAVRAGGGYFLATINVATGSVTSVGASVPGFTAISILRFAAAPTPTPSSLLLLGAGMLFLIGWNCWRTYRRRGTCPI